MKKKLIVMTYLSLFFLVLTSLFLVQSTFASNWAEVDDAGPLPCNAQVTVGTGRLTSITGTSVNGPWLNDVDLYKIYIPGGVSFSAEAVYVQFSMNTKMFLFDSSGLGILANDDQEESYYPAISATNLAAGFYFLATAPIAMEPLSAGGKIFPDEREGLLGPTGPGGSQPVIGYTQTGYFGAPYKINITGAYYAQSVAQSVPDPATILLLGVGLIGLAGVRKIASK